MGKFDGKTTMFVYGTLMKDFGNERVISMFPHENYKAKVSGVEMYSVHGAFPALVKGDHEYFGELVVFADDVEHDALFRNMDGLEGYRASNPESSMYLRVPVTVEVDGEMVDTEVYLWNRPTSDLWYIDPSIYSSYRDFVVEHQRKMA